MHILSRIALSLGGNDFLLPYFEREFATPESEDGNAEPESVVAGIRIETDAAHAADCEFDAYCDEHSLPVLVLRCAAIVGTGMNGLPRRIAKNLFQGVYFNIRGNEARIRLVHAVDVAAAAALAMGAQGTYVLTDGCMHTIRELGEALSYRMGDKRVFDMPPMFGRLWYLGNLYDELTTDHVCEDTFALAFPDFAPHDVIHYLRNHVYDENSL